MPEPIGRPRARARPLQATHGRVADIPPAAFRAPGGHGSTWRFAPRWPQSQIHNALAHSGPPGQKPARSQSPSTPDPVVETFPVESLPIAGAKAEGSSGWGCTRSARGPPPVQIRTTTSAFFLRLRTVGFSLLCSVLTRSSAWIAHWLSVTLPSRRISWINNSSTSSAVFNGPSAFRAIPRMLCTRSMISGCSRSCLMSWVSLGVNSLASLFFCFIPTVFTQMAKFVHFILQKSSPPSPT